jgi:hypothetical protein
MARLIARIVVMTVLIVVGTEAGALASDKPSGGRSARQIEFTTVGPNSTLGTPLCSPEGQCVIPVSATSTTVTGDLTGAGYHAGTGVLLGDEIAGTAISLYVGTIEGCGTGTFVAAGPFTGTLDDIEYGKGKVLVGTGDFEGMTGTSTGGTSTTEGDTVTSQSKLRISCPGA